MRRQPPTHRALPTRTPCSRRRTSRGPTTGSAALQYDPWASNIANGWAVQLAASGALQHNPNLVDQINSQVTPDWTRIGENVGFGPSIPALENTFMNSPPHKANILGQFNRVGIGAARDGNGTLWVVVDFVQGPAIGSFDPPGTFHPASWLLRSTPAAGSPDADFNYGVPGYQFVSGDWNADGKQSPGVYFNGTWYLRNSASSGSPDVSFAFGAPGYMPVVGDWNGDGKDTIGVYYQGWWYLRNSNTPGPPDIVVYFGNGFYYPVVGDWNGNGKDSVGVYVNGMWYLRNTNTSGAPDIAVNFGAPGYTPFAGAWTRWQLGRDRRVRERHVVPAQHDDARFAQQGRQLRRRRATRRSSVSGARRAPRASASSFLAEQLHEPRQRLPEVGEHREAGVAHGGVVEHGVRRPRRRPRRVELAVVIGVTRSGSAPAAASTSRGRTRTSDTAP